MANFDARKIADLEKLSSGVKQAMQRKSLSAGPILGATPTQGIPVGQAYTPGVQVPAIRTPAGGVISSPLNAGATDAVFTEASPMQEPVESKALRVPTWAEQFKAKMAGIKKAPVSGEAAAEKYLAKKGQINNMGHAEVIDPRGMLAGELYRRWSKSTGRYIPGLDQAWGGEPNYGEWGSSAAEIHKVLEDAKKGIGPNSFEGAPPTAPAVPKFETHNEKPDVKEIFKQAIPDNTDQYGIRNDKNGTTLFGQGKPLTDEERAAEAARVNQRNTDYLTMLRAGNEKEAALDRENQDRSAIQAALNESTRAWHSGGTPESRRAGALRLQALMQLNKEQNAIKVAQAQHAPKNAALESAQIAKYGAETKHALAQAEGAQAAIKPETMKYNYFENLMAQEKDPKKRAKLMERLLFKDKDKEKLDPKLIEMIGGISDPDQLKGLMMPMGPDDPHIGYAAMTLKALQNQK